MKQALNPPRERPMVQRQCPQGHVFTFPADEVPGRCGWAICSERTSVVLKAKPVQTFKRGRR